MTIWYDYTTTLRNQGRSGIANVEWSTGEALQQLLPGVRPFALVDGELVEFDPTSDLHSTAYAATSTVPIPRAASLNDRIRSTLARRLGWLAVPVIRRLAALNAHRRQLEARARAVTHRPTKAGRERMGPQAAAGDVVISLGAVWSGEMIDELARLRDRTGCRVVMMVFDLIPLTHTHLAFNKSQEIFERYYSQLLTTADFVTCISRASERSLHDFADSRGITAPPTQVLRLGDVPSGWEPGPGSERDDFFLCVGTVERRKNYDLLFDALRILESEGAELPRIVVVGAPGWGTGDLVAELELRSTESARAMTLVGSLDDVAVVRLYSRARAVLFPSHFEGWGLPVREAVVRGCPVAAGDSPAVREALDGVEGARLLPTDDPEPWARYLADPGPTAQAPEPVTWRDTAMQMVDELVGQCWLANEEVNRGDG